ITYRPLLSPFEVRTIQSFSLRLPHLLQFGQKFFSRQRHAVDPDAGSVINRWSDRGSAWTHGRLADTVRPEDSIFLWFFDKNDIDAFGHVQNARWPVIQHVCIDRQPGGGVDQQLFMEDRTQRHHDTTLDLLLDGEWIDRFSDIVRGDVFQDLDAADT